MFLATCLTLPPDMRLDQDRLDHEVQRTISDLGQTQPYQQGEPWDGAMTVAPLARSHRALDIGLQRGVSPSDAFIDFRKYNIWLALYERIFFWTYRKVLLTFFHDEFKPLNRSSKYKIAFAARNFVKKESFSCQSLSVEEGVLVRLTELLSVLRLSSINIPMSGSESVQCWDVGRQFSSFL